MNDPYGRPARPRRRRRSRARSALRPALVVAGALILFGAGIAVGQATRDNPEPGTTQTLVRTLAPATVSPLPETVTVTVSSP